MPSISLMFFISSSILRLVMTLLFSRSSFKILIVQTKRPHSTSNAVRSNVNQAIGKLNDLLNVARFQPTSLSTEVVVNHLNVNHHATSFTNLATVSRGRVPSRLIERYPFLRKLASPLSGNTPFTSLRLPITSYTCPTLTLIILHHAQSFA